MAAVSIDGLNEQDQVAVQKLMSDLDMKQTERMFTNLTSLAFKECVNNFRGRTLERAENKCIEGVVTKYMAHFQRINVRFGEEFVQRSQAAAQQMQEEQGK